MLGMDDCHICLQTGGGGYGDPLRREPEAVLLDVQRGLVSVGAAQSIYGVVVRNDVLNITATDRERERLIAVRLADSLPVLPAQLVDATPARNSDTLLYLHPVADTLEAVRLGSRDVVRCTVCATTLSNYGQDYKRGARMREMPISAMSPLNEHNTVQDIVLREYLCPTCGTSIALDVQRQEEPILDEASFG